MTNEEMDVLFENSKDDRHVFAGSEVRRLIRELGRTRIERDKLQEFKDYVHSRLDRMGVPTDPDSPHKAEGCRAGGRLDWVFERMKRPTEFQAFKAMLERAGVGRGLRTDFNSSGHAVSVETGENETEFMVTEFGFDDRGQLKEVTCYPGDVG